MKLFIVLTMLYITERGCCAHYVAYQGERYASFNTSTSHRNSITLLYYLLLMAIWTVEEKQKAKFQIIFALRICFMTLALLFVCLERPLI